MRTLHSLFESVLSPRQDAVPKAELLVPSTSTSLTAIPFTPSRTSRAYRQLKKECLRKGQLFVDLSFPPTNESLFLDTNASDIAEVQIEWKRPGEIVDNPKLFVEGASPCDVTQGILGNCWFVSACSALTHNEALLQKVIPDAQGQEWADGNAYCGLFQFCFWRFGRWVDLIIDDLLPTKEGQLLFARSKTPNEFWSALLEKAFAKLYGCYENLVGGQLADALQDVSGGVAETLNVRKFLQRQAPQHNGHSPQTGPELVDPEGAGRLFRTLKHAFDREALIVAAIAAKKEEVEKSLDCGLIMGHAYAVTAIRYIELDNSLSTRGRSDEEPLKPPNSRRCRQAMVRLQNPWGMKEWNGPWSDGSAEWEQVGVEQKRRLGITVDEDGEFWMPWEGFIRHFTDISVCQLLNTETLVDQPHHGTTALLASSGAPVANTTTLMKASRRSNATLGMPEKQYREWTFFGRWTSHGVKTGAPKDRAGGCPNFPASFCCNPQYAFTVQDGSEPVELMFALTQRDTACTFDADGKRGSGTPAKQREPFVVIGLHLMRVELNRRHRIHQAINPVASSDYLSTRSVYMHVDELAPGRYIVLPTTYAPREEADFMLRMYSTGRLDPLELEQDQPPVGLFRCRFRIRCVVRLRLLEVELVGGDQKRGGSRESDLFCRVSASGERRVRTSVVPCTPGQATKLNECFVFHGESSRRKFVVEVFEQRKPFKRRNKCLGRAQLHCYSTNECVTEQAELKAANQDKESPQKTVGTLRAELCAYDDPLYI